MANLAEAKEAKIYSGSIKENMIQIPAGEFLMGEGNEAHPVYVAEFYLARYPVTNGLYQAFVTATGHQSPRHWPGGHLPEILSDHPVVNVSWADALAYCRWLTAETGQLYRLPTEAELEKAARGVEGRLYPWGNEFDKKRCNTSEAGMGGTTPVDYFPTGANPEGVMDLAGNVWEWCSTLDAGYPYCAEDGREDPTVDGWRILRGGSWFDTEWGVRSARRLSGQPNYVSHNTGFRVVCQ